MTRIKDKYESLCDGFKENLDHQYKKVQRVNTFLCKCDFFWLDQCLCRGFLFLFFSKILKKDVVENKKKHTLAMLKVSSILKIQVGVPKDWSKPKSLNIPAAKVL